MAREEQQNQDPMKTGVYYQQSRKPARLLPALAIIITAGFLGFVVYDSFFSQGGFKRIESLKLELEETESDLRQVELENSDLRRQINQMKNGALAIEKEAREQLGLIKPGETVYIFKPRQQE